MKSTLFNMVMVLFVITLLASAGVGAVHMITEEPIAEARVKATREALKQVLPEFDETEVLRDTIENLPVTVHTASEKGRVVGYAVESMTKNGFSGVIRLMVGFAPRWSDPQYPGARTGGNSGAGYQDGRCGQSAGKEFCRPESGPNEIGREEGRRRRGCPDGGDDFVAGLCRCRESGL